ncbi:type VI secretion system tip protein VgrG [Pseudomonas sp. App30]|uniref:type VI secretion system Vgr family protein n=1 Tax=Pseudomonas sp. App30 TaxID=3068990 RepID=UPI003A803AB7
MAEAPRILFDHTRHRLSISQLQAPLDVLAFEGEERLSQCFTYRIEFTSTAQDITAEQVLRRGATFRLFPLPTKPLYRGHVVPPAKPLRSLRGVVTGFRRLSGSRDEARYEITLQPKLALLAHGKQYRIYQQQSVPEIVESVLRRHDFEGYEFHTQMVREFPRREQVMQFGESDLAFIERLLAEVGIWYCFFDDVRVDITVLEFHDHRRGYQFGVELPYTPPSGVANSGQDSVWALQSRHQVVEQHIDVRTYRHRDVRALLDAEVDQTRATTRTTYGEAYHFGDPYDTLGNRHVYDDDLPAETGIFYARMHHERYLTQQACLSGTTSSPTLAPRQVLTINGDAPQAFKPRIVITELRASAARDSSFIAHFQAIPYIEAGSFRPPLPPKPIMAGTVAARVTSYKANDPYSHIDLEGRYSVTFLFDRHTWPLGRESLWLRLARPYAGATHGLHLPLIPGTEVAVAFEHGDPDRPYIAHALHDSEHPDPVTLRNHKRNVLRTPANNKLRMDDTRGQEHVKLASEFGGKSQLNLGHVVDAQNKVRGGGFELRTDAHGALRAGKGVLISADEQGKAQGEVLEMASAIGRLQQAGEQLQSLSSDAEAAKATPADLQAQLNLLRDELEQLKAATVLVSAPKGIALTSGKHLQLAAHANLMANAGANADISVVKRLFMGVGQGLSVFVRKVGVKLIANQGPVSVQAQNDRLELMARHGLDITSTEDEIHITAKKKITLNAGGSYITLDPSRIEAGTEGDCFVKSAHFNYSGAASMKAAHPEYPVGLSKERLSLQLPIAANSGGAGGQGYVGMPYTLYADGIELQRGILDKSGQIQVDHQVVTRDYRIETTSGWSFGIPIPAQYRNPEQAHIANRGVHNHTAKAAPHTEHRSEYASIMDAPDLEEGTKP